MPKRAPLLVLLAASIALSAAASGCGQTAERDSSGTPVAATPARVGGTTKQEFIARADAICERMNGESVAAAKKLKGRPIQEILARALAIQGRAIRELRALEPPPGDEKQVQTVLRHLDRLQKISRMLDTEGEEVLAVVAGIAVETDAVARSARRYGMFRNCDAYRPLPGLAGIKRGEHVKQLPTLGGAPPLRTRRPMTDAMRILRIASGLVPPARRLQSDRFCGGGDPEPLPTCVIVELAADDRSIAARHAEIARLAARKGWKQARPMNGEWSPGLLSLYRDGYNATVRLAARGCTRVHTDDGPDAGPVVSSRCADTIMITAS